MGLQAIKAKNSKKEGGEWQTHTAEDVRRQDDAFAILGLGDGFLARCPPEALRLRRKEAAILQFLQVVFRHAGWQPVAGAQLRHLIFFLQGSFAGGNLWVRWERRIHRRSRRCASSQCWNRQS